MLKDLCFEIIEKCPNNCIFCSSCAGPNKDRLISFEMFKKVIDHLCEEGGIEEISLSGGEPLLHPDLLKMIIYCKMKGIRVVLFTSGIKKKYHLSEEDISLYEYNLRNHYSYFLKEGMLQSEFEELIASLMKKFRKYNDQEYDSLSSSDIEKLELVGLDKIVFDFQAWNQETYNKMMGTVNYYELFLQTLAAASDSSLDIDIHFIPTKLNYKELPDLIEMLNIAKVNKLRILNFVPQGRGKENEKSLGLTEDEHQEFREILSEEKEKFNGQVRIGIPYLSNDTHMCTAGLSKMVIKYDGTVLPCPAFKEYDLSLLNKMGIKTPNIFYDLDKVKLKSGVRKSPLCKKIYGFDKNLL